MPVGVRGMARHERFAALLAFAEIADRLAPEDLTVAHHDIEPFRKDAIPALAALRTASPHFLVAPRVAQGARRQVSKL